MTIDLSQLIGLAGAPVIVALVQLAKVSAPTLDSRWWPAVTLGVAVAWNIALGFYLHGDIGLAAVLGVVTGLAASGLYSHATTLVKPTSPTATSVAPHG